MIEHPLVTWTTPMQSAEEELKAACEHFEFHRWAEGLDCIDRHMEHLLVLVEQVRRERGSAAAVASRQVEAREDHQRQRLEELRGVTGAVGEPGVVCW